MSSNTFPSIPLIDPESLEFEMNVDGFVSSGGLGGPAILPQSLAKMAQMTQAFPDRAFSGIGGIATFAHALNYFLLGCGTVQVCTAAMLDHAIGPNIIKGLIERDGGVSRSPRRQGLDRRSRTSAACAAIASSRTRRSAGPSRRSITAVMRPKATRPGAGSECLQTSSESPLWNPDLAPTTPAQRTWTTYNIAALWIGMSVVITTYTLASGIMQQGMTWWQAMITILLGNTIVLVPMILNAHAGTKYGVSFPVLCRAAFGVRGANVPAILRAIVACGWFGIQTWIGGLALHELLAAAWPGWASVPGDLWIAFFAFWLVQVAIILRGLEGIKMLESWSAPLLLGGGAALLWWAVDAAAGSGASSTSRNSLQQAQTPFWTLFPAALTANVGYWATLSLNIPDFTRYAQEPAIANARAGAGLADDDDGVCVHRRGGDQRDDRDLRRGDLGSDQADRANRFARRHHSRRADRPRRAADDQHGGQRRVAGERFFESGAEAHQLRDRRTHHGGDRHRDDAVEALCRCGGVHLHVAHRLLEPDGRDRRHSDCGLLAAAPARAVGARSVLCSTALPLLRTASTRAR